MGYGLWAGGLAFDSQWDQDLYLLHSIQSCSMAHPASYTMGNGAFSLRVKQPGHEAEQSLPSIAKVHSRVLN
jgi:hypothetical protein